MAVTLPSSAIIAANAVSTDNVWLLLLEIQFGEETIRICRNTESVSWRGHIWEAFPFTISDTKTDNKGSLSNVTIEVDNTTREIEYYLNNANGGTGSDIVLYVVRFDGLEGAEADLEEHFSVKATNVNDAKVIFTLGNSYNTRQRRPWRRYMKNSCPFKYKGVECGCNSELATCNHTLSACRERGNSTRFGGFPGIPQGGSYV